METLFYK